jgi:biopolymer transport protein ExbD
MAAGHPQRHERGRGRRRSRPMSEINVTPFVDVMLVLLIVFMVTAPLLTVGVPVDLPKTKAQALGQDREPLSVTIRKDGRIYVQNTPVADDDLVPQADGDCRQRLRPAHLRARRQSGRLRPRHGSDGNDQRRGVHPYRARDGCRKAKARPSNRISQATGARDSPSRGWIGALALHAAIVAATLFTWTHRLDMSTKARPSFPSIS